MSGESKGVVPEFDKRQTVFSVSAAEKIRQTLFSELPVSTGGESEASVPTLPSREELTDRVARVRQEVEGNAGG